MGYLPGFATPRIVCDVPYVGKRWVHQVDSYDTEHGMSFWRKNYRTSIEGADTEALSHEYVYYDPIYTLPQSGQDWWREHGGVANAHTAALAKAAASRKAQSTSSSERRTGPSSGRSACFAHLRPLRTPIVGARKRLR